MIERHHVEAWVNRNLWLEEDFEAIVNDIMKCGSDNEEVWLIIWQGYRIRWRRSKGSS